MDAASRATTLTRQLLGFSRRTVLEKKPIDPNRVVADLVKMIRPLFGARVQIETSLDPETGIVYADPGELQQALLNLCLNARDAMPSGGKLTLRTQHGLDCSHNGRGSQGPCAMIQVVDTGCGMSAETRQRVFEPFYTTKEVGKGTGLGLANVHGVVHQHGGAAEVESQLGKGTTFTIHLPTVDSPFAGEAAQDRPAVSGGAEIVLVAEDEELVRNLAQRILEQAGYTVLAATDGAEALQLFRQNRAAIRLVLLDAAMPNLSGCEVFAQIRAESPETKILLASGYARETVLADMEPGAELHFIAKPVDMATLLRTVREAIEEGRTRPVAG